MAFQLRVDPDLCQGHGICLDEAPDQFDFDDGSAKAVSRQTPLADRRRAEFDDIARMCPTAAIALIDQE